MNSIRLAVTALIGLLFAHPLQAQDSSPGVGDSAYVAGDYRVFTGAGQPASLDDVVAMMGHNEVVFIGETHDDPTGHAIELELFQRAHAAYGASSVEDDAARSVVVSLEFFQRDAQPILDEYLAGLITEKAFKADSRPWPRYETDYRPIVEYAKDQGLPVIAANAPRRYTNRATRLGRASLDGLSEQALATIAPLPYGRASRAYLDQWVQTITSVMEEERMNCGVPIADSIPAQDGAGHQPAGNHGVAGNQFDGQVLWDATMAYWINDQLVRHPNTLVLHMVGAFHVARRTGIPEHLVKYRPGSSGMIVVLRPVDDIQTFEQAPAGQWGDFVIQTDRSRTLKALECRTGQETPSR
jgi:uncharacterized iron-regulated protein